MDGPVLEEEHDIMTSRVLTSKSRIIYKITFEAAPKEIMFELRQKKPVFVRDVIHVMKANFKNANFEVMLDSKTLDEMDNIKYGKTYIVKYHLPVKRRKKKPFYV